MKDLIILYHKSLEKVSRYWTGEISRLIGFFVDGESLIAVLTSGATLLHFVTVVTGNNES
jgi:hypothetical protein